MELRPGKLTEMGIQHASIRIEEQRGWHATGPEVPGDRGA